MSELMDFSKVILTKEEKKLLWMLYRKRNTSVVFEEPPYDSPLERFSYVKYDAYFRDDNGCISGHTEAGKITTTGIRHCLYWRNHFF